MSRSIPRLWLALREKAMRLAIIVGRIRILKETQPGSIVLSHDIHPGTIEAMPSTLDALAAKGFKFVTVSEVIRMAVPQRPSALPQPEATASVPATVASPSPSATPSRTSAPRD